MAVCGKEGIADLGVRSVSLIKRIALVALLMGFGILLALGALEGYLRVTTTDLPLSPGLVRTHATRRYELVPGFRGKTYDKPVQINSLGLRDFEVSRSKQPGVLRIVCLGDSVTFGHGALMEDTYPKQLERMIRDRAPSAKVEALNFGVPSYNTASEIAFLKERGVTFAPDVVVLEFTVDNDAETVYFTTPVRSGVINKLKDRLRQLYLYNFLALKYYALTYKVANLDTPAPTSWMEKIRRDFSDANPGWQLARTSLEEFYALSLRHHFIPIIMIFPIVQDLDRYAYGFAHAKVREAVGDQVEVLDLLPYFAKYRAEDLWVSRQDGHPNKFAHSLMAEALFDVLHRKGVLK